MSRVLNNRYYDPTLARFTSVDPMGRQVGEVDTYTTTPQHWNPYSYAGGNPTTQSDPSGLCGAPEVCNPDGSTHDSHVDFEVAKLQPGGGRDGYYLEHNTCGLCTALELFNWGNTDKASLDAWHDQGMKESDLRNDGNKPGRVGVDVGCYFWICAQAGVDSKGGFFNLGIGPGLATPSIIVDGHDNDEFPRESTEVNVSASAGPIAVGGNLDVDRAMQGDDHPYSWSKGFNLHGGPEVPHTGPVNYGGSFAHWWRLRLSWFG